MRPLFLITATLLAVCCATVHAAEQGASITLVAPRVVRPNGRLGQSMAVVVRDGKIRRLIPADKVADGNVRRFTSGEVVCPGMIDLFSTLGAVGQTAESVSVIDPQANAVDAIDPFSEDFDLALRSGLTAAMVVPQPGNLVSGAAVTFSTFVEGGRLNVYRDDGPLVLGFGGGVWRSTRPPTSRAGALYELRQLVEKARAGLAHDRVNAVAAGGLDALVVCDQAIDLAAVRDAWGDNTSHLGVTHTRDAIHLAEELGRFKPPVLVGPYSFTSSRRVLLGAAALSEAGIEVAFIGGFPAEPLESLRITAALAVRHGMNAAAARRGLTVNPAKAAGLADRLGALARGRDADLVVFSGDPLRLDSRVLEVYVRGVRVYSAANQDPLRQGGPR